MTNFLTPLQSQMTLRPKSNYFNLHNVKHLVRFWFAKNSPVIFDHDFLFSENKLSTTYINNELSWYYFVPCEGTRLEPTL